MGIPLQVVLKQLNRQLKPHSETAALDAQVLIAHYLEKSRSWIMSHPEAQLEESEISSIIQAVNHLIGGEPLPYIIGHWEFYGLDFLLTPAVLIPRPETELLVDKAIDWLKLHIYRRSALDIGTGSGCIGISLAKHIPDLHVLLTDISPKALDLARINAENHILSDRMEFRQADLLQGVPGTFDLVCANLPYIPASLLVTLPVAKREPRLALDGGSGGMELIGRLLDQSRSQLRAGGLMLLEIEASQGEAVKSLAQRFFSFSKIQVHKDLAGHDRCLEIVRPNLIVHLCQRHEWPLSQGRGSYQNASLIEEGFIHVSQPDQILEVANHFYPGSQDLVLMWIDPDRLSSEVRWELAERAYFPHIYGPIDMEAVISITELKPGADGVFRSIQLPDESKPDRVSPAGN